MVDEPQPLVWVIDSDQWPRAALRAQLLERGYEAVGFTRILRALAKLEEPGALPPELVVLELRDQEDAPAFLDAWRETGLPTILLGGAQELVGLDLAGLRPAAVLRRPFTVADVVRAVDSAFTRLHPPPDR